MVGEDEVPFRLMGGEEPFLVPHYLLFASWSLGKELKKEIHLKNDNSLYFNTHIIHIIFKPIS